VERGAAGGKHLHGEALGDERRQEVRDGGQQMLAVIEQQQHLTRAQVPAKAAGTV